MAIGSGMTVGFIGLGSMGIGMAQSSIRAGLSVAGCDVDPQASARLAEVGGRAAANLADAARNADAVVVVVNAAQTEAFLFGADGAASAIVQGAG